MQSSRPECREPGCTTGAVRGGIPGLCIRHGGGRRCTEPGCGKGAQGTTEYCTRHGGGPRCAEPGCDKGAIPPTEYCKRHGGGPRCIEPGCDKGARGSTGYCIGHGGGRRCIEPGCDKGAVRETDYCIGHGGGQRCAEPRCDRSALPAADYCMKHGGGPRCVEPGCARGAISPSDFCIRHGGGQRCAEAGCDKSAAFPTEYCVGHWPRCTVKDCWAGSHDGTICAWHATYGVDAENDRNWARRTRRLYVVHWPEHGAVKIGVEVSKGRITKWRKCGAELIAVWEVDDPKDADASHSLYQAEQACLAALGRLLDQPENEAWLDVVGPRRGDGSKADGYTETFYGTPDEVLVVVEEILDDVPASRRD